MRNSFDPLDDTPTLVREPLPGNPLIVPRDEHGISRKHIDPDALKVMYRLIRYGHRAFLVGGGVRDLLLGKRPKDFDIGTDATPERVRQLFRNSRIIGRRFRINHVFFVGGKVMEVATFRALLEQEENSGVTPLQDDNTYGDPESDAVRRDLTINGLFYDLSTFSVIDYVGGIRDLRERTIRFIGVPEVRVQEDPVRMIRAIRHAARTGFTIERATYDAIVKYRELIRLCPQARVTEEVVRELRSGCSRRSLMLLEETGLLEYLFPFVATALRAWREVVLRNLNDALGRIDAQILAGAEIPTAVLYLSLAIGNVLDEVADAVDCSREDPVLQYFWNSPPALPHAELPRRKRRRSRSKERERSFSEHEEGIEQEPEVRGLSVEQIIILLFRPIGATRKEVEAMEMILRLRRTILTTDIQGPDVGAVINHSVFWDALWLIRLTAEDDETRYLADEWEDLYAPQPSSERSRAPRGGQRRRRRPRRRR